MMRFGSPRLEAIRKSIERLLGHDHEIVTVDSGEQAQILLEKDQAFDVILCDLMMSGMSGMALRAWLAVHDPSLAKHVVFITGGAFTARAIEHLTSVGNPTLEKPFDAQDLKRVVSRLIGLARDARVAARFK
jgi:DNA-binding NtrC family response regulator